MNSYALSCLPPENSATRDKQIADYVKTIRMTERLDEATMEDIGRGPRTVRSSSTADRYQQGASGSEAACPQTCAAPIPPPDSVEQARVLDAARDYARDYSKNLPNFICTQVTRRYEDPSGLEFWQSQDTVVEKLSFFEQKEDYKLAVCEQSAFTGTRETYRRHGYTRGVRHAAEGMFDPKSEAQFDWERWATLRGKRMHVFRYPIAQERSEYSVQYGTSVTVPGMADLFISIGILLRSCGSRRRSTRCRSDSRSTRSWRSLTTTSSRLPTMSSCLPLKASTIARMSKQLFKNDVEFRNYNRFGAEATITFAPDPLPDDQLKEQPAK